MSDDGRSPRRVAFLPLSPLTPAQIVINTPKREPPVTPQRDAHPPEILSMSEVVSALDITIHTAAHDSTHTHRPRTLCRRACTTLFVGGIVSPMRPEIDDDVAEAVNQLVDEHTRVPADHLTFNQRLEVLVEITHELSQSSTRGQTQAQSVAFSTDNQTNITR